MLIARLRVAAGRPLARLLASSSSSTSSSTPVPPLPVNNESGVPVAQAPNRVQPWSTSQQPRPTPNSSPRFEQVAYEYQPAPLSAMELVNNEPVIFSDSRIAVCDGGGGPLGHPKIFINLDRPGPRPCGYCGLRFEKAHSHH